jgi:CHAD domain-containing protein
MADGKWISGLTPEMPVAEAAKAVLGARFEVVRQFMPLVMEQPYNDPEYVHQLRVGTRRAGAALRVFGECLPRKQLRALKRHLRAIRQAAGDARDWDVFRLGLPSAKSLTSSTGKPALDFLLGYALGERSSAQARLSDALLESGAAFRELSLSVTAAAHEPQGDNPPGNFGVLAAIQFGDLLGRFDDAVRANPTEPTDLHALRILGKRARYALEIFASCFPPVFRDAVYPAVEKAQELLGEIQDAAVGRDRLTTLKERIKLTVPNEWTRLQKGIDGLIQSLRSKIPAGRKAFSSWQKEWSELIATVKIQAAATTTTLPPTA